MSEFEIAGVTLSTIPLVISALGHYSDGIRILKNMKDYPMKFDDFRIQLDASIGIHMNTCYELLRPLSLPDDRLATLLSGSQAEAWLDMDLQTALKTRLGDSYHRYASLQDKLHKRVLLFCRKLKLNEDGRPPWIAPDGEIDEKARRKFFQSFWLKTKGGFNTEKYGILLAEIDRDIEKLSRLAQGAMQLEPIKMKRKTKSQSAHWQNIRDQAQQIFDTLDTRFSPCPCTHTHHAKLRLDIKDNEGVEAAATKFTFLFTFDKHFQSTSDPPWKWRDVEIQSSQLASTRVVTTETQVQSMGKSTTRSIPSITVIPCPPPSRTCPSSSGIDRKIDSLCGALSSGNWQPCCLGLLEDECWQHRVYLIAGPASTARVLEVTSLQQIIYGAKKISPREKCTLALTLAFSVLQLHDTPWLPSAWTTNDISLLNCHGHDPDFSQFYVSQTFTVASAVKAFSKTHRLIKNETVFSLGVALLELAHGTSIQSFKQMNDLDEGGKEDCTTELSIANRLAMELVTYESENYARAVFRCITCNFDTFTFNFDDREFREAFYQAVIVPLQADFAHVTGGKP